MNQQLKIVLGIISVALLLSAIIAVDTAPVADNAGFTDAQVKNFQAIQADILDDPNADITSLMGDENKQVRADFAKWANAQKNGESTFANMNQDLFLKTANENPDLLKTPLGKTEQTAAMKAYTNKVTQPGGVSILNDINNKASRQTFLSQVGINDKTTSLSGTIGLGTQVQFKDISRAENGDLIMTIAKGGATGLTHLEEIKFNAGEAVRNNVPLALDIDKKTGDAFVDVGNGKAQIIDGNVESFTSTGSTSNEIGMKGTRIEARISPQTTGNSVSIESKEGGMVYDGTRKYTGQEDGNLVVSIKQEQIGASSVPKTTITTTSKKGVEVYDSTRDTDRLGFGTTGVRYQIASIDGTNKGGIILDSTGNKATILEGTRFKAMSNEDKTFGTWNIKQGESAFYQDLGDRSDDGFQGQVGKEKGLYITAYTGTKRINEAQMTMQFVGGADASQFTYTATPAVTNPKIIMTGAKEGSSLNWIGTKGEEYPVQILANGGIINNGNFYGGFSGADGSIDSVTIVGIDGTRKYTPEWEWRYRPLAKGDIIPAGYAIRVTDENGKNRKMVWLTDYELKPTGESASAPSASVQPAPAANAIATSAGLVAERRNAAALSNFNSVINNPNAKGQSLIDSLNGIQAFGADAASIAAKMGCAKLTKDECPKASGCKLTNDGKCVAAQ
jgi:hypothetical protein